MTKNAKGNQSIGHAIISCKSNLRYYVTTMLSLPVPVKICALKKDAKIFCKFFSHLLIKFDKWKSSAKEI